MEKRGGLILPLKTEIYQDALGKLTKVEFSDGTHTTEADFGAPQTLVLKNQEGIVSQPDEGRYPFSQRLAQLFFEYYEEHGSFPTFEG